MSGKPYVFTTQRRTAAAETASGARRPGGLRKWGMSLAVVGAAAFGAAQAQAGTTSIGKSKSASEATHEQILEKRYGGDFSKAGDNYSNGSVSVTRIDDSADQTWQGNFTTATAVGAFARRQSTFGVFEEDGGFNPLFTAEGKNFNASGSADLSGLTGPVKFGRDGGKPVLSSDQDDNRRGKDHLVSYEVSGLAGTGNTFLLFWEDTVSGSDWDFNDLVVELRGGAGGGGGEALLIPLPAAAWSGLMGLGGLGLFAGWRKARRAV